jgi:hypothetical protein
LEEALWAYGRAIELRGDYTDAQNNAGIVLVELGRLDEAIDSRCRFPAGSRHKPDAGISQDYEADQKNGRVIAPESVEAWDQPRPSQITKGSW